MKHFAAAIVLVSLALAGCSKKPEETAYAAEQKKSGNYDVKREPETTPELVLGDETPRFMVGTEGDFTVKSANFDIGKVESGREECAKIVSTKKVSAREWQLHLKFTKVESDSDSCDIIVYPVRGSRRAYTYVRVDDNEAGKAARAKEEEARAKADEEKRQQEYADAMQKMADTKSIVASTVGKSWDVKFGNGEADKWTVTSADMLAQMKNNAGEQFALVYNADEKKWMATGGGCVYEVTINGASAKGKASFCQKASRSAFTATINK
jgi:hypothetical protein